MFAYKKYLIQQIFIDNFGGVLEKNDYSHALAVLHQIDLEVSRQLYLILHRRITMDFRAFCMIS